MIIIGVDPGKKGALVSVDTIRKRAASYRLVFDKLGDIEVRSLVNWVCSRLPDLILLETPTVSANDKQWGKSVVFSFGDSLGQVKVALRMSGRPIRYIKPTQWQKEIFEGITAKIPPKDKALIAYKQFYPGEPIPMAPRQKKPHDGEIDALLVATYGVLKYGGGQIQQWEFIE